MDHANSINIHWAILCTGWGRNAKDVINYLSNNRKRRTKISMLIYEKEPCGAAMEAKRHKIEALKIQRRDFSTIKSYQNKLLVELKKKGIDRIFLMNYKYRIRKPLLEAFPNKIYNVHPSLFPSFLGTKTAIQDSLDYGVKITGITTHIIDHELDKGTILLQKAIKINPGDTFDSLYPKFTKEGKKIILRTIKMVEKGV